MYGAQERVKRQGETTERYVTNRLGKNRDTQQPALGRNRGSQRLRRIANEDAFGCEAKAKCASRDNDNVKRPRPPRLPMRRRLPLRRAGCGLPSPQTVPLTLANATATAP